VSMLSKNFLISNL